MGSVCAFESATHSATTGGNRSTADELVVVLDRIARQRHVSRSQLIREAVEEYTAAERTAEADRRYVESYTRFPQEPDPGAIASAIAGGKAMDEEERQAGLEP